MNRNKVLDRSHQTLYSQIANIWRDRILSGEFKPGDVLPSEREIAAELEVSRIPVREAMKSLEYLGVVRQQRGRGVVVQEADLGNALKVVGPLVTTITPDILENLFDFRILIEPYAAEQAALYATESELLKPSGRPTSIRKRRKTFPLTFIIACLWLRTMRSLSL